MFSEQKVNQVFDAIKENGLSAFDDESLAKLLSILNKKELDFFESKSYEMLNNHTRISNVKPLVEMYIENDMIRIRNSEIYQMFIESLKFGRYQEYFTKLKIEELGDIKKYLINTVTKGTEKATKKIINMITQEIYTREEKKNLVFN